MIGKYQIWFYSLKKEFQVLDKNIRTQKQKKKIIVESKKNKGTMRFMMKCLINLTLNASVWKKGTQ